MFQESLVESTPLLRTRNRWPFFASIATQATILAVVIAVPLLRPEIIPTQALHHLEFLPVPRPKPPIPPPQPVRIQTAQTTTALSAPPTQPAQIDPSITHPITSDLNPVDSTALPVAFAPASPSTSPFSTAPAIPAPHVVPTPNAPIGPLHISEGVLAGNLISAIRPQYPPIARAAGVQGTVIIQATISTSGTIVNAHVISGPLMLQPAALDAVRNARYRPYLLNHQPTEVETTFSINFRLGS